MEASVFRSQRASARRGVRRKLPDPENPLESDDEAEAVAEQADLKQRLKLSFSSPSLIFYALLVLKIVLWVVFAWVLSHLHMGLSFFVLVLSYWLYKEAPQRALSRAKRRL